MAVRDLADQLAKQFVGMLAKAVDPIRERLNRLDEIAAGLEAKAAALEARAPEKGEPGKDADIADLIPVMEAEVEKRVSAIPAPRDGLSAFDVSKAAGFEGDEAAWLLSLRGEKGEDGAVGPQGPAGADAFEVAKSAGFAGTRDEWLSSLRGKDGVDGRDGRDGKSGAPGRDALALDVLPGIDEGKSYVRGTFATHRGGLWRAFETTEGMRGWECVMRGVAETQIEQVGERGVVVREVLSDGAVCERSFSLPVMIYRGVFAEGQVYEAGDSVSFGGSVWVAKTAEPGKPGDGPGWQLAVKRGRDGRDGEVKESGPKGPVRLK